MTDSVPRYATRDFTDEGTGRSFVRGRPLAVSPGELANYEAAGLAGGPPAEPKPSAPPPRGRRR